MNSVVMKSVSDDQLHQFIECKISFRGRQYELLPSSSPGDLLVLVSLSWPFVLDGYWRTYLVALNTSNAVGSVWRRDLLSKILAFSFPAFFILYILGLFDNRTIFIQFNGVRWQPHPINDLIRFPTFIPFFLNKLLSTISKPVFFLTTPLYTTRSLIPTLTMLITIFIEPTLYLLDSRFWILILWIIYFQHLQSIPLLRLLERYTFSSNFHFNSFFVYSSYSLHLLGLF